MQSLRIDGGGAMIGVVTGSDGTTYARADLSGFYKREANGEWTQMLDELKPSEYNLMGASGIAIDPKNSDIAYAAVGQFVYSNNGQERKGAVLKTTDGGKHWRKVLKNVHFGSLEDGRSAGEPIAVSPHDSNVLFVLAKGHREPAVNEYLYKSINGGITWDKVTSFPSEVMEKVGFVEFSKTDANTLYVGVNTESKGKNEPDGGLYKSADLGLTWEFVEGSPSTLRRVAQNSRGELFFASSNSVMKYDGSSWTKIKESSGGFSGIDIDPRNDDHIILVGYGPNTHLFVSTDGGNTWTDKIYKIAPGITWNNPSTFANEFSYASDVKFSKNEPGKFFVSDWYGVFEIENISAAPVVINRYKGIENTVGCTIKAFKNSDYRVMAGFFDVNAYKWTDIDMMSEKAVPATGNQQPMQDVVDIDYCEGNPNFVVKTGVKHADADGNQDAHMEYSIDGGKTWNHRELDADIFGANGSVYTAVASNTGESGFPTIIATALDGIYFSEDMGGSWTKSGGTPSDIREPLYMYSSPVAADRIAENTFYAYDHQGMFYVSRDGGKNFTPAKKLASGWVTCQIETSAETAGRVLINTAKAIYLSEDYGTSFKRIDNFVSPIGAAFGKDDVIYAYETQDVRCGIYASCDLGKTWELVTDYKNNFCGFTDMDADKEEAGIIYVLTDNRGAFSIKWNK